MLSYRVHCPCLANPRLSRRLPSRKPCAAQLLVGARVRLALRSWPYFSGVRPLRPELHAALTMLVAEHGRVSHSLAGWQIAVVVLRYFVAVLMLGEWIRTTGGVHRRHRWWGPSGSNRRPTV